MDPERNDGQHGDTRPAGRSKLARAGAVGSATVLAAGSAVAAMVALAGPASAATFTVNQAIDDGTGTTSGTLSWAIAQANNTAGDDVVDFDPSLSTITFTGDADQVVIDSSISIVGPGADVLEIDYDGNCSLAAIATGSLALSVSGVTLANGVAGDGDCANDRQTYGGGLAVTRDDDETVSLTVTDVTFADNYASYYGGGLFTSEITSVTITDSLFVGNDSLYGGGGAYINTNGPVVISTTEFAFNGTDGGGGGLNGRVPDDESLTVTDSFFFNNGAGTGGGAYFENGCVHNHPLAGVSRLFLGRLHSSEGGGSTVGEMGKAPAASHPLVTLGLCASDTKVPPRSPRSSLTGSKSKECQSPTRRRLRPAAPKRWSRP